MREAAYKALAGQKYGGNMKTANRRKKGKGNSKKAGEGRYTCSRQSAAVGILDRSKSAWIFHQTLPEWEGKGHRALNATEQSIPSHPDRHDCCIPPKPPRCQWNLNPVYRGLYIPSYTVGSLLDISPISHPSPHSLTCCFMLATEATAAPPPPPRLLVSEEGCTLSYAPMHRCAHALMHPCTHALMHLLARSPMSP